MNIKKAVITAAGAAQRRLPLQTLVDRNGEPRSVLSILTREALDAGIEEVLVVVAPGDENAYAEALGPDASAVRFLPQSGPRGYAQALLLAQAFTGNDPFLHLVSDHLFVSASNENCARRLLACAREERCAVSAVHATHEHLLPLYGTIGGRPAPSAQGLYEVDRVIEKPTPTQAERDLIVPGLRAAYYLCYFGLHVLTPSIYAELARLPEGASLSLALDNLRRRERYLALEFIDHRYDLGGKYGLLSAQFALALKGRDREEVLARLLEILAR